MDESLLFKRVLGPEKISFRKKPLNVMFGFSITRRTFFLKIQVSNAKSKFLSPITRF